MTVRKSQEWLKQRLSRIGGSNAAAAVGLSPYKTQTALYFEMTEGRVESLEDNPDVRRGIWLEPVCRQRLADELGMQVVEHNQDIDIRSEQYPWAGCIPDGWIMLDGEKIPIEIKVPRPENWRKLDEEIPDTILCQATHNAAVIGAPALMLVCMCPVTLELFRHIYEPRQDAIDALMEAEASFYENHLVPRVPPAPVSHEDLKLLFPSHTAGRRITATEAIEIAWSELIAVRATAKNAEERKQDLSLSIKAFLEDGEVLISKSGQVLATYKSHLQTSVDVKRLKADMPEIYQQFANDKPVRVFLPKTSK